MRLFLKLATLILFSLSVCATPSYALPEKVYRLGFPLNHDAPPYAWLLEGLENKGFVAGKNLQVVYIDLKGYQDEAGRERIRQELARKCDLFFTGGASLEIIYKVAPQTPLLFINFAGPERVVPPAIQANTTGVRIGSETGIFQQAIEMLPPNQRQKMGLIHFEGSSVSLLASGFQKTCEQLGFELVIKKYAAKDDIDSVMQAFKTEGVGGVMLLPPACREGELEVLIASQNKHRLPLLSIIKQDVEKGLLGGPAITKKLIKPSLTDYAAKILLGRSPAQLPIKFFSPEYVLNLATASKLGIEVPAEVVSRAEIVGMASVAAEEEAAAKPLMRGNYVLGISKNTPVSSIERFLKELGKRGYVQGKNLTITQYDLDAGKNRQKQREIAKRLAEETNIIFANGSVLPSFTSLPDLKTPVCFVSTKETADTIPAALKQHFTGVIRASFVSIIQSAQRLIPGLKKVAMIGLPGSNLKQTIGRHQRNAATHGVTLDYRLFNDKSEIGPLMRELQKNHDAMLLYSPGVDDESVAEIIKWQNQLGFPVLAQFERHVQDGLLAGLVVDMDKVSPKLAEYADKLLQGRTPDQLPPYYYSGKMIINLRTASKLQLDIPAEVTSQAEIIR
ncbi:MAG: hypothetical protein OEV73_04375 [Desulfobulbaceae bacterium]|nr:hypothetical protein [Desulfobulbaceae bacterium]